MIKNKSEIEYNNTAFSMEGSVVSIKSEGNKDLKQPIRFVMRFEESGEFLTCVTWNFNLLEQLKTLEKFRFVSVFKAVAVLYKDAPSIRIGEVESVSSVKSKYVETVVEENFSSKIKTFIDENIKDADFSKLLNLLIFDHGNDFFEYPAAKAMHHNYTGGLAKHSFNVARRCKAVYDIYGGANMNLDLLLTGALLHDIGKLKEYTKEGQISSVGEFSTHLVLGVEMIDRASKVLGINPDSEKIKFLKHIIISHHGKLEYGSPITPKVLEALVVSQADDTDAKFEGVISELETTTTGEFTETIKIVESRIYKHK